MPLYFTATEVATVSVPPAVANGDGAIEGAFVGSSVVGEDEVAASDGLGVGKLVVTNWGGTISAVFPFVGRLVTRD